MGPKQNQKILDLLLRFRVNRIAIVADIEKAFVMVSMAEKDRDVLRFLWFKDVLAGQHDVIGLRFTRVVFGVSSSPFLLNATLRHHLDKYESSYPNLIRKLRQSLYVDDLASGASDEEQAYQMFVTAKKILKDVGFNLRKFYSSSEALQARVNPWSLLLRRHRLLKSQRNLIQVRSWGVSRSCVQESRRCSVSGGIRSTADRI